ncbi:reverse transcriptase domain-containing protein [Tanacetum coccineum]
MKAGILRRVKNQMWVPNPFMVKKSDRGWRIRVDVTDINKACLKDCYPLLEIDWKVESLLGFRLKCFLNAYQGYHQIQMAEKDEDKTAFFAGEGTFCYRKMPFGLKNARATYQRLVDKVFSDQIGKNLEAYIDDLGAVSSKSQPLISFELLWSQSQPSKCFGNGEGLPTWLLYNWDGLGSRVDEMILARERSGFAGEKSKNNLLSPLLDLPLLLVLDDPYVVARDAVAAIATSDSDDDDDTAFMDLQPYKPRGSPHDSQ